MGIKGESIKADIVGYLKETGKIPVKVLVHKLEPHHSTQTIELGIEELNNKHFIEIDAQENISLSRKVNVLAKEKLREYRDSFRSQLSVAPKLK